jgi:hypothetical protein
VGWLAWKRRYEMKNVNGILVYTLRERLIYNFLVVWVAQWITIIEALIGIVTFGWVVPFWEVNYMYTIGEWLNRKRIA